MQKMTAYVGEEREKFSQRRKIPKLPLILVAIIAGTIGVYFLVNSFAAVPPAPTGRIFGANNAIGWGDIDEARQALGVNGDRTCHDETNLETGLVKLAAAGMRFTGCVNSYEAMTSLNNHPQDYANLVADQVRKYGPGGTYWTTNSQYAAYAIQHFELMNEPYGWWYRNGDNDPAAYAHLAAAGIRAGKAANPQAKFFIPLSPSDVKLKNGTWIDWNKALLAAEPDLFKLADGFSIHLYYTPSEFASILDQKKNWAWSQPGGNGKPFLITEANLTDQYASPEADYVAAIPQFVQIVEARDWVKELFIFCWHGFSGRDYLGFVNSSGTPRPSRIEAYRSSIQKALAAESPTPTPAPTPTSDTTAPTVSLTAPISGAAVSGTNVPVSATASDNVGVAGVQFKVDGNNVDVEDTTSPYGTSWNTTGVSNGSHSVIAVARDAAGNTKTSAVATVTVNNTLTDTTPPRTPITSTPTSTTTSTEASFGFASSESASTFQCKLDTASYSACTSPKTYSGLTIGSHTFSVRAIDAAGNIDATPTTYTWNITTTTDTVPPAASFTAPVSGSTVSGIIASDVSASDNRGIDKVEIYLDGSLKATERYTPYEYSFDSKTVSNGTHTLTAKAFDAAGNASPTASSTITVKNADTTPPPAPTNLKGTAASPTSVALAWSASMDAGTNPSGVVKYNVLRNGIVIAQVATTSFTDIAATANTTYTYSVRAVDAAGNVSAGSNTATVTTPSAVADTTAPSTPSSLKATAVSWNQVNVTWSASIDTGGSGLAGYNIYRNGIKLNSSLITSTSYGDATLRSNTTYSYTVEAVDGAGNKSSKTNPVYSTTPKKPRGKNAVAPESSRLKHFALMRTVN